MRIHWMLLLISLLTLLACAPAAGTRVPTSEKPAAAPQAPEPQKGGVFVYAGASAAPNLDPYTAARSEQERALGPIYDTLLTFKNEPGYDYRIDLEVFPMLAERWEQPNKTTYVFYLRRGVKWQDGEELTADDVVWTYKLVQEGSGISSLLKDMESIEALDRYTVRLTTRVPSNTFLQGVAHKNMMIGPKHVVERGGDLAKVAIGTGPFKLKSHDRTRSTIFERNENYWQQGKPYLSGIECLYGLDASAQLAAFKTGKTDMLNLTDKTQFDTVRGLVPDLQFAKGQSSYGSTIFLKQDRAPFNDVRVRRAIHLAIDRQSLLGTLTAGDGIANPPAVPGFKRGWAIPQEELLRMPGFRQPKDEDLAEAKRLLADAGYPNGFKFNFTYSTQYTIHPPMMEPIAYHLSKIGVEAKLAGTDTATYQKHEREGTFEVIISLAGRENLEQNWQYYHSKGNLNRFGLKDPKLDELIERYNQSFDPVEQKRAVIEIQRLVLDNVYGIPTIDFAGYELWQSWVQNYSPRQSWSASSIFDGRNIREVWFNLEKLPAERR